MMAGAWWAWPVALGLYLAFRAWYDNWRGPLTPAEVEAFLAQAAALAPSGSGNTDLATLRAFLAADDGREFVMTNLVSLHTQPVPHPATGVPTDAQRLMDRYARGFVPVLLRTGGHPLTVLRKVGGYVDSWNTPPDPGWHIVGAMRYRSRRDMMRLALHPGQQAAHPFKIAAIASTFSFPTQVVLAGALRPRTGVALILATAAALVHLASVLAPLTPHTHP